MKRFYLLFSYCWLLFSSCSNNESQIQEVYLPDAVDLVSTAKHIDTFLLFPTKLFLKADKFIIFEPLNENMFKVFDFPSFNFLYSFGSIGGGPNEFQSDFIGDDIIDNETLLVEVFDQNQIKFVDLLGSSPKILSMTPFPLFEMPINRLKKMNDSIYYYHNWSEVDKNNEFARININTGQRTFFSPYPNWVKNLNSSDEQFMAYSKSSAYSFARKMIVAFYYHFPVMKFLDFAGNVIKEVRIKTQDIDFSIPDRENKLYFVEYSFLTDDYIYVLWFGGKNKDEIMNDTEKLQPEILVFDWDGQIAGRYRFDKPITPFTISEETGKIYGVTLPEEDVINDIYEYDLPKIANDKFNFKHHETDFYSVDFFEGFVFSQGNMEVGINYISERNGNRMLRHAYYEGKKDGGKGLSPKERKQDFETFYIILRKPIDGQNGTLPGRPIKKEDLPVKNESLKDIKHKEINIDGLDAIQTTYYTENLDPLNKLWTLYYLRYDFQIESVYIEISINSHKDNLEKYQSALQAIIQSFKLKKSEF